MWSPHTWCSNATQEGLTAETRESPKVDTLTNSHLGYRVQSHQSKMLSAHPADLSLMVVSPSLVTFHSVGSHWKDFGSLAMWARFACWPGAVRRATEDRWQRRRGGTPVIKAASLLAATALGKSLKWLCHSKSKWRKQVWGNVACCARLFLMMAYVADIIKMHMVRAWESNV